MPEPTGPAPDEGYRAGFEQGLAEGRREGRDQGRRTGYDEGLAQARAQAAERLAAEMEQGRQELESGFEAQRRAIAQLAAELALQRRQCLEQAEDDLVALGFELTCKVLGPALVSIEGVRAQALRLIERWQEPLAIHVPSFLADELAQIPCDGVRWIADEQVDAGVVVEGRTMRLDARLDVILGRFRDLLLEARSAAGAEAGAVDEDLA